MGQDSLWADSGERDGTDDIQLDLAEFDQLFTEQAGANTQGRCEYRGSQYRVDEYRVSRVLKSE
jgi:hypothetical protein